MWLPFASPPLGTWPITQACAPTGNQTIDPLVQRPALNPLSHTNQHFRVVLKSFEALRYFVQNQNALFDNITEILDIHVPTETKLYTIEQALLVSL